MTPAEPPTANLSAFVVASAGANTLVLSSFAASGPSTVPAFFTGEATWRMARAR